MVSTRIRRSGTTLMEVLIATMILSVGLVAIMALFPIGAINFARAINQDRSATHGVNSDSMFRFYWKRSWVELDAYGAPTGTSAPTTAAAYDGSGEPMILLLDAHPQYGPLSPVPVGPNAIAPGNSSEPSFPVLVDPIGWQTKSGIPNEQGYVGGINALPVRTTLRSAISGVPTRLYFTPDSSIPGFMPNAAPYFVYPPPHASDIRRAIRDTTLLDDITFDANGNVDTLNTRQVERAGRYSASWLIRRDRNDVKQEVHVHVLVFGGRPATDTPSPETAFPGSSAQSGSKTIYIPLSGQAPPNLRKGGWIAFSHRVPTTAGGQRPTLDFYRVVGVNDDTLPGTLIVEIETSIKEEGGPGNYTGPGAYAIVFENLLQVFDRGLVSSSGVTGH